MQQVRVGESCSLSTQAISDGIIQDSVVGPGLYTIFIESLLRAIRLPSAMYADNIEFIADATLYSTAEVQAEIHTVVQWSDANYALLSFDKCSFLHCSEQPYRILHQRNSILKSIDNFKDLGVIRSIATNHAGHYQALYQQVITKAAQV